MKTKTLIPMLSLALGLSVTQGRAQTWSLTGNAGTTAGTHFLGTTDGSPLSIQPQGTVGIGVANPADFSVAGNFNLMAFGRLWLGRTMTIGYSGSHFDEIGYNVGFVPGIGNNDKYTYVVNNPAASMRLGWNGGMEFRTAPAGTAGSPLTLTTRMQLTEDGRLGIGTSNPETPLDVRGKVQISANGTLMYLVGTDHGYISYYPKGADAGRKGYVGFGSPNEDHLHIANESPTGDIRLFPAAGRAVYVRGNVGIGITSPQAPLDVAGQIRSTTLLLTSDRHAKTNFLPVDPHAVLQKVAHLPLNTWHYTNAPGVRHLGPMAQDFKAAFPDLGEDDKHIATVDADGVIFAAVQALHAELEETKALLETRDARIAALEQKLAHIDGLAARVAAVEKLMAQESSAPAAVRAPAIASESSAILGQTR